MRLFLHICCAPCLIYPYERLIFAGFKLAGYFLNSNIHPQEEYSKRRKALEDFSCKVDLEVIYPQYAPEDFFTAITSAEPVLTAAAMGSRTVVTSLTRCPHCWYLRLKRTAVEAKMRGYEFFSTTLLVSPYQNHEALKEIGARVSQEESIKFHYEDFRPGFKAARDKARQEGLYLQKYCGCEYSRMKRCKKSVKH